MPPFWLSVWQPAQLPALARYSPRAAASGSLDATWGGGTVGPAHPPASSPYASAAASLPSPTTSRGIAASNLRESAANIAARTSTPIKSRLRYCNDRRGPGSLQQDLSGLPPPSRP